MLLFRTSSNNTSQFDAKAHFKATHKGKIEIIWSNITENSQQTEFIMFCSNWT